MLDLVRNDEGKFCLILEFLGYKYYEVGIPEAVDYINQELVTAYRLHFSCYT